MVNVKGPQARLLVGLWCSFLKQENGLAVLMICKHTSPSTFIVLHIGFSWTCHLLLV